jgi:hypothetical protein
VNPKKVLSSIVDENGKFTIIILAIIKKQTLEPELKIQSIKFLII